MSDRPAVDPSSFTTIRYETSAEHVATITLDRPEVLNAFDRQMCHEVRDAWNLVKDDPEVHAVVLRAEHAAQQRPHAQYLEIIPAHQFALRALRTSAEGHAQIHGEAAEQAGEDGVVVVAQSCVHRIGDRFRRVAVCPNAPGVGTLEAQHHELLGIRNGQPAQENLIQQREDGGIRANPQSQRHDGNSGEARRLPKDAQPVPDVLKQASHDDHPRKPMTLHNGVRERMSLSN